MHLTSEIWAFELSYKISTGFQKKKHKLMNELEIFVRITKKIMLFLEKFNQRAKILHFRR